MENVKTRHAHSAAGRRHEAGQDPHRRAFARAVWAEQADDLPARHRERNARHGGAARVAFRQINGFDHRLVSHQNVARSLTKKCRPQPTKTPARVSINNAFWDSMRPKFFRRLDFD